MNARATCLGQGNRANPTIGRALQLVVRNVGGGRPRREDRAAHGHPGKLGVVLRRAARRDSPWEGLAQIARRARGRDRRDARRRRGAARSSSTSSRASREDLSRPASRSALEAIAHPKQRLAFDALLAGRARPRAGVPRGGLVRANGCRTSCSPLTTAPPASWRAARADRPRASTRSSSPTPRCRSPKFAAPDRILVAYAGGDAGLFSMVFGSWAAGEIGSQPCGSVEPWR